ncbi:MAG TPA: hypothetical protein VFA04_10465 [Bryobacteraceae bacterium]|nr:hypothetical protein [Bryobacteraceae bacterium]
MPELQSEQDALQQAQLLFKIQKGKLPANALEDYARIAWFFTRADANMFEAALEDISQDLWAAYCRFFNRYNGVMRNMFTHSIREVAEGYGWQYDTRENVVLTGGISGAQYEKWTRAGVLFKDQMDLKHGEHSHTFQWLAVCARRLQINLNLHPTVLYKQIFDVMNQNKKTVIVPDFKTDTKKQGASANYTCWSWVADCFPKSLATGQEIPAEPSLFSERYRTPQIVMKYLLNPANADGNFIKTYLQYRYKRRRWVSDEGGYDNVSGGGTAKSAGELKHLKVRDWKQVEASAFSRDFDTKSFYDRKEFRNQGHDTWPVKKYVQVTLHGQQGYLTDPQFLYQ